MLLLGLVFTRGVEKICADCDDVHVQLVGTFSYCSQELVHLALLGVACSHVFDGKKEVGGQVLRGVMTRGTVGHLSLLEHYKYVEVGDFLKCPRMPVWVVGSESHYTVLFQWISTAKAARGRGGLHKQQNLEHTSTQSLVVGDQAPQGGLDLGVE